IVGSGVYHGRRAAPTCTAAPCGPLGERWRWRSCGAWLGCRRDERMHSGGCRRIAAMASVRAPAQVALGFQKLLACDTVLWGLVGEMDAFAHRSLLRGGSAPPRAGQAPRAGGCQRATPRAPSASGSARAPEAARREGAKLRWSGPQV